MMGALQVHPKFPGKIEMWEATGDSFSAVAPSWCHGGHNGRGNITWVHHLFESNRDALYKEVVGAMVRHVTGWKAVASSDGNSEKLIPKEPLMPFKVVGIAGDGRCGWRAILAASDITTFCSVPRTGHQSPYIRHSMFTQQVYIYTVSKYLYLSMSKCTYSIYIVRNDGRFPLNGLQNALEIEESKELCADV